VTYVLAAKLADELVEAADDRLLSKSIAGYGRVGLLLLGELGYLELDKGSGTELLFQVLTEREEKASVAVASNGPFSGWTTTSTDPRMCAVIVDRPSGLTHWAPRPFHGPKVPAIPDHPGSVGMPTSPKSSIWVLTQFLIVLAPWAGLGDSDLLGQLACLAATASYGAAFVYLRRYVTPRRLHAIPAATVQVSLGAILTILAAPWTATTPVTLTPAVVGSILALGALGTGLAYVWNTNVVNGWGATNASTVTYLTPVVGVALGALILNEQSSWHEPLGALVVILGIAITQNRLQPARLRRRSTPLRPQPADDYVI
jgi:multisubunit Na+/H+ antiporter MnhG subunit